MYAQSSWKCILLHCYIPYSRVVTPPLLKHNFALKRGGGGGGVTTRTAYISVLLRPPPLRSSIASRIESTVREHHVYKTHWSPSIEELCCEVEEDNTFDRYAVAVTKDGRVVGHVPRELARICYFFLKKQHSTMTCTVTDKRRPSDINGKGLVVPCIYIFKGKERHIQKLISCFT